MKAKLWVLSLLLLSVNDIFSEDHNNDKMDEFKSKIMSYNHIDVDQDQLSDFTVLKSSNSDISDWQDIAVSWEVSKEHEEAKHLYDNMKNVSDPKFFFPIVQENKMIEKSDPLERVKIEKSLEKLLSN